MTWIKVTEDRPLFSKVPKDWLVETWNQELYCQIRVHLPEMRSDQWLQAGLQKQEYPLCCGITQVFNFSDGGICRTPEGKELYKAWFSDNCFIDGYGAWGGGVNMNRMAIAAVPAQTAGQNVLYDTIAEIGEVISTFKNPVHNSVIRLVQFNPTKLGKSKYDFSV